MPVSDAHPTDTFRPSLPPQTDDDGGLCCANEHPRRPVEWLWPNRIPLGKVTLLAGDPGLGKSLVAIDVAARITTGAAWPDAKAAGEFSPSDLPASTLPPHPAPASVLILTAEDDVGDTVRPRLAAHGANINRVFFAPKIADLRHDFAKLVAALNRVPDCRLIIVDPVNMFVGPNDSHFHTVARRVLAPLAELAAERGIAILAVTHFRKNQAAAIYRASGSMGFVAASRTVWTVCRDKEHPGRNLLLPVKNNLGPLGTGLAYTIESHAEFDAPALRWEPQRVATSAEEAFTTSQKSRGPEAAERWAASRWLSMELLNGPRAANDMMDQGRRCGFHPRTLRRGLEAIGGTTNFGGPWRGWTWSLAPTEPPAAAPRSAEEPAPSSVKELTQSSVKDPAATQAREKPVPLTETCPLSGNSAVRRSTWNPFAFTPTVNRPPATVPTTGARPTPADRAVTIEPAPPPKPLHPLAGHPVIDQILWRLRAPTPDVASDPATRPSPAATNFS